MNESLEQLLKCIQENIPGCQFQTFWPVSGDMSDVFCLVKCPDGTVIKMTVEKQQRRR